MDTQFAAFHHGFLDTKSKVNLPTIKKTLESDIALRLDIPTEPVLDCGNYCLMISQSRKFPFFTSTSLDPTLFKSIARKKIFDSGNDEWSRDARLDDKKQLGTELYNAPKSDFDRGHMTKREDAQWGKTEEEARISAQKTFLYTNSVPQVAGLNQRIWGKLETYILKSEALVHNQRIVIQTGPVLKSNDPFFVTPVKGESIRIPTLFWKIVYYTKADKKLYRVGFIMGQRRLLLNKGIIEDISTKKYQPFKLLEEPYLDWEEAETYQVNVKFIEKLSGLKFSRATELYKNEKPEKLILENADIDPTKVKGLFALVEPESRIGNLML